MYQMQAWHRLDVYHNVLPQYVIPHSLASLTVSPQDGSNVVSKPDNSQSRLASTHGPRCLDEQPLQQSALLCHTQTLHLFCEW
jgi:hypothetical protein